MMRCFLLLTIQWLLCGQLLFADHSVWQPERTWVFAVGVLKFDDNGLATWPDAGRVDAVMLDAFRQRGVPKNQIVFLKNEEATRARVTKEFASLLRGTRAGDTLVFYYAGHGGRDYKDPARAVNFLTYDTKATWTVREIVEAIETYFNGSQVLLTADCCHSGALADEAARRSGRISYGVLTSAQPSARSTGNWTFTQALVDLLNGTPTIDLNRDGRITFAEGARHADVEMAFCENQRVSQATTGTFAKDLVLAAAGGRAADRVGELCEGEDQGKWWKVKIINAKSDQFQVTWIGWGRKYDSWLEPAQLRRYQPELLPAGAPVKIEWKKKWYDGTVVRTELGLLLVHYDGYPASDDEWVPSDRVRAR